MRRLIFTTATIVGACLVSTARAENHPQAPPLAPPAAYSPLNGPPPPHAALGLTPEHAPAPSTLPNVPLVASGAILFGGAYGASVFVGALSHGDEDRRLLIPVAGPWLDLAGRGECGAPPAHRICSAEGWNRALLVGDGVVQAVGVGVAVAGFFVPSTATDRFFSFFVRGARVEVAPARVGVAGYGVTAVGSF